MYLIVPLFTWSMLNFSISDQAWNAYSKFMKFGANKKGLLGCVQLKIKCNIMCLNMLKMLHGKWLPVTKCAFLTMSVR